MRRGVRLARPSCVTRSQSPLGTSSSSSLSFSTSRTPASSKSPNNLPHPNPSLQSFLQDRDGSKWPRLSFRSFTRNDTPQRVSSRINFGFRKEPKYAGRSVFSLSQSRSRARMIDPPRYLRICNFVTSTKEHSPEVEAFLSEDQPSSSTSSGAESIQEADVISEKRRSLKEEAEEIWAQNRWDSAIAKMKAATEATPSDYDGWEKLGDMYLANGQYAESIGFYTTALRQVDAAFKLHQQLQSQPQSAASNQAHNSTTATTGEVPPLSEEEANERRAFLLVKRGEAAERTNKHDAAEADYKRALKVNRKCFEANFRLGYLYLSGGYLETAERHFKSAVEGPSEDKRMNAEVRYGLALVHLYGGKIEEAKTELGAATELDETYAPAHFKRGEICQKQGLWTAAIVHFDKFLVMFERYYPSRPDESVEQIKGEEVLSEALLRRGHCYLKFKDARLALDDLDRVIALGNPRLLPLAHQIRGQAWYQLGEHWKAIEECNKAIALDPKMMDSYFDRSMYYELVDRVEEAKEDKEQYERMKRERSWEMRQRQLLEQEGAGGGIHNA